MQLRKRHHCAKPTTYVAQVMTKKETSFGGGLNIIFTKLHKEPTPTQPEIDGKKKKQHHQDKELVSIVTYQYQILKTYSCTVILRREERKNRHPEA